MRLMSNRLVKDVFDGPLRELVRGDPEYERNPIEHPELAYRRGYQQGAYHIVAVRKQVVTLPPALLAVLENYAELTVYNWRYPRDQRKRLRRHIIKDGAPELNVE
jgi:hypothetical protein